MITPEDGYEAEVLVGRSVNVVGASIGEVLPRSWRNPRARPRKRSTRSIQKCRNASMLPLWSSAAGL